MKRIVIIGGGPAGLTAAYELLKQKKDDYEVIILEESDTLGGISRTIEHDGNRMDIGGHRFFSKDDRIMEWWREMLPLQGKPAYDDIILGKKKEYADHGPDPEVVDEVMLLRERVSRIYYNNTFFDYPVTLSRRTIKGMGFFTTLHAGFSYLGACIHRRKETNLENFYINRFGKVLYRMFFEGYTEKLWGRHPSEISADWGSQRVKGLSILSVLGNIFGRIFHRKKSKKKRKVETSLIEEFWYPKYGPGQLWEYVGKKIETMGGVIRLHHRVKQINIVDDRIDSLVCDTGRGDFTIDADIFLSSMPVKDLIIGIMGDKRIMPEVTKAARELPYRDFVTIGLLVRKLELVNETEKKTLGNIVPDCWIYVQDNSVKLGRIQVFNNWSPYLVEDPDHTVWIGLEYFCNDGDEFWNMSDEECVRFAIDELSKMGVICEEDVLDSHRERVRNAYPAYFDGYEHMDDIIEYLDEFSNLYCIGRNGQHRYNNMDHSMATAFEAVRLIHEGSTDKSTLWSINTEAGYHEKK
ncbi:MAG: NAD(P)/FAD-dependent oxidoreductase [Eubacterium sp.]|nr:NAD(P)/FAD-dependent oxidoreductase [Eubacterium sp.]